MASRPAPLSALRVCTRLAKNSIRRLESAIECTQSALDTNSRLTAKERAHYYLALRSAEEMVRGFELVIKVRLPKAPPKTKKKIGRPSNKDIARSEAARRTEERP